MRNVKLKFLLLLIIVFIIVIVYDFFHNNLVSRKELINKSDVEIIEILGKPKYIDTFSVNNEVLAPRRRPIKDVYEAENKKWEDSRVIEWIWIGRLYNNAVWFRKINGKWRVIDGIKWNLYTKI